MLLAVHIPDGILGPGWLVAGFVVAGILYWLGVRRIRDEEIPRIALLTAVFFIATTLHIPIGPTTSVHLLGNALVGVLLGWRAGLAIPVGLLLQAILLGHGGRYALGVNSCIMTLPALLAWALFHGLHRFSIMTGPLCRSLLVACASLVGILSLVFSVTLLATNLFVPVDDLDLTWANWLTFHPLTLTAAGLLTAGLVWAERFMENAPEFPLGLLIGELTVVVTVALNFVVLLWGGETYFPAPLLIMLVINLPLAVIEGVILGITIGFLMRVKPEMLKRNGSYVPQGGNLR